MKSHSPLSIILTTLLVVAFGWGSVYLVVNGLRTRGSETVLVEIDDQQAMTLSAKVVNPLSTVNKDKIGDEITVMVGGDMIFDRGIRAIGERNGYDSLFDDSVTSLLKKADIVAANLEGPITSYPSKTLVNGKVTESLIFTFSPKVHTAIKNAGITIVSLANNHTDNFNFLGFMETQDWLKESGILWFGNPWNSTSTKMSREKTSAEKSPITTIINKNGITVAFVGYHSFQLGIDRVLGEIRRVSLPDVFTIVMPHWGEEYQATSSSRMKSQARSFIAAGADAVIGAHPHVIMDQEWVGNVPIVYSLGNLLFDQYFSPEVIHGNIVELHIIKDSEGVHLDQMKVHDNYLIKGKGVSLIAPVTN